MCSWRENAAVCLHAHDSLRRSMQVRSRRENARRDRNPSVFAQEHSAVSMILAIIYMSICVARRHIHMSLRTDNDVCVCMMYVCV